MTDEVILKKAIAKAVKNGFDFELGHKDMFYCAVDWNCVIFSHDFAKAFWKDKEHSCEWCGYEECVHTSENIQLEGWQEQLMNMVLEPEPLKYLEQFLEDDK